jgi:hypothetical protein
MPDFLAEALTWPKHYGYAIAVQTAMDLSLPPTVFLETDRQPTDGWSPADKKLAMAWTILNKETCKNCGQPLWICRSSNKNLLFKVRTDICYSDAELEKWKTTKKAKNLKKGEHAFVVAEMRGDEPMPSRSAYLESLMDE